MQKKFKFLFFAITLFVIIILTKDSQAVTTLNNLQEIYPEGAKWEETYNGIKKTEKGYAKVIAKECAGFAALMYNRYYGIDPYQYAEEIYDINDVGPGDIVRYGNNKHSVWILSRNGDKVQVAECNYDLKCSIRWYETKSLKELSNGLTYIYKAPFELESKISSRAGGNRATQNEILTIQNTKYTKVKEVGWQMFIPNANFNSNKLENR